MEFLRRSLESYLGLEPTDAGGATVWDFVVGRESGAAWSVPVLVGLALCAALLTIVVYWRDARHLPRRRRGTLLVLRLLSCALLVLLLGQISLRVDRAELPPVAVLVDTSASMELQDRYSDPAAQRFAASADTSTTGRGASRLALVRQLLSHDNGDWWQRLASHHRVELFHFDEHLHVADDSLPGMAGGTTAVWNASGDPLTASGRQTAPAAAVQELFEMRRGVPWSAIVLLTDGVSTSGPEQNLVAAARVARDRGVPLFVVGVGSADPVRDVELVDVLSPEVAFVGDSVGCSLRVRQRGFSGRRVRLLVTSSSGGEPLAEREVTLGADGSVTTEEVLFVVRDEGDLRLAVEIVPLNEEADRMNNRQELSLAVRGDRLRVLLVERQPRWEYRALKPLLERDDSIELRTFLVESDLEYAREDRTALGSFPADDTSLTNFDVVLWGDVDLAQLDPRVPDRLRTFVAEQGGGLILMAGPQYNPAAYTGTALEILLPVRWSPDDAAAAGSESLPFRFGRTPEGRAWPFTRLSDDPQTDEALWRRLPADIDWSSTALSAKPAAQVLAVRESAEGVPTEIPLLVHQRLGRGQILFHATDELWRWRRRMEDRLYGRYWTQAIRAIARSRLRHHQPAVELSADRRRYEPGDDIRLRLALRAEDHSLSGAQQTEVQITSDRGFAGSARLNSTDDTHRDFEGLVQNLPVGDYRALWRDPESPETGGEVRFAIVAPDREANSRPAAVAEMQKAARVSLGRATMVWNAGQIPGQIPRGEPQRVGQSRLVPLWNRWEVLVLLVVLLSAEWLLRRRSQLV